MSTRERGQPYSGSRAYLLAVHCNIHRKTESNESVYQGKLEKLKREVWSRDTTKKEENRKPRKKETKGRKLRKVFVWGYRQCPFIGTPR